METQTLNHKVVENNILEIRGILRMLSEDYGQSIAKSKRFMELNTFLKELEKLVYSRCEGEED